MEDLAGLQDLRGLCYAAPPTGATWRSYYYAGSTRVAMRVQQAGVQDVVSYLHGDHPLTSLRASLGSASLTTDASGAEKPGSRTGYYPYGATRYGGTGLPTDYRFTGQRSEEASLGSLYDYGARRYSPVLGRFISADTIVPSPGNPQSLNRYSYVLGNPLRYTDPTGHDWFDRVVGGLAQYLNDITLGVSDAILTEATGVRMDQVTNADYQQGREYGRAVSVVQGAVEAVVGSAVAGTGAAAGPPTVALAAAAALPTGGVTILGGSIALTAEGVMVVGGSAAALHGAVTLAYIKGNPVTRRPSGFRKETVQDAWDNAKDGPTGGKLCPTCGEEVTTPPGEGSRDWDIDHQPPWSQRDLTGMGRKKVLDEYNRGTRLECPYCNRARGARVPQ